MFNPPIRPEQQDFNARLLWFDNKVSDLWLIVQQLQRTLQSIISGPIVEGTGSPILRLSEGMRAQGDWPVNVMNHIFVVLTVLIFTVQ
jgi:hypothetical protein